MIESNSEQKTLDIAVSLSKNLQKGDVIGLVGELGAGKTCFTKGIAKGLNVNNSIVTSPTFVLMQSYMGTIKINHYDLYRLDSPDLTELGFYDSKDDSVSIIEWAEKVPDKALGNHLKIEIARYSQNSRKIKFVPVGILNLKLENFVLNI